MRKQSWIIAVLIITVMAVGIADMAVAAKKKAKGQDLYKEFCNPCHGADADAGEYNPMTLIQDQWERFFDDKFVKSHQDVCLPMVLLPRHWVINDMLGLLALLCIITLTLIACLVLKL